MMPSWGTLRFMKNKHHGGKKEKRFIVQRGKHRKGLKERLQRRQ